MPRLSPNAIPSYRQHKQSGQAIVTLSGRDILLGPFGSKASRTEYDRVVAEWIANGRRWPEKETDLSVAELLVRYWEFAEKYYAGSKELENIKHSLRPLRQLYDGTPAKDFGPLALEAVRNRFIQQNCSRNYINQSISRIKRVFKWGVAKELIPPSIFHGLSAVSGLKRGRCEARESEKVRPVSDEAIHRTLEFLSPTVRTMIELQLLTGMRPGEVCLMRTGDIDRSEKVWSYSPEKHKTEHHGHARTIWIGPKAQQVLTPFLKLDPQAYIFSPTQAEDERHAELRKNRKTRLTPSQIARAERAALRIRLRAPGDRYDVNAYRHAIARACDQAFPAPEPLCPRMLTPNRRESKQAFLARLTTEQKAELAKWRRDHRWHPHQLRHSAATRLRKEYGLEVARVILGHHTAAITEVYAEMDSAKAREIMGQAG